MAKGLLPLRSPSNSSSEQARDLCGQVWHGTGGRHLVPGSLVYLYLCLCICVSVFVFLYLADTWLQVPYSGKESDKMNCYFSKCTKTPFPAPLPG